MTHVSFTIPKDREGHATLAKELWLFQGTCWKQEAACEAIDRVVYEFGILLILDAGAASTVTEIRVACLRPGTGLFCVVVCRNHETVWSYGWVAGMAFLKLII